MRPRSSSAQKKKAEFPGLKLPIPIPFAPMEALRTEEIPLGTKWQYEPKWDGFRALVFRDGDRVVMQSKSGQPLDRYFPELVEEFRKLKSKRFVVDGEIVLLMKGALSFDDLQLRLHPAASRIEKLSKATPASFICFDLLYDGGPVSDPSRSLVLRPLHERRERLERFFRKVPKRSRIRLSQSTCDPREAKQWFTNPSALGLDGIMAKDANEPYHSGDREAMLKIKHLRSADCVVAGYRLREDGRSIAALTLGLYDDEGRLNHVGSASTFTAAQRKELLKVLRPLEGGPGFTGSRPGQSRWSRDENEWIPIRGKLVCEVQYDTFTNGRFRHGTKFLRWRPEKAPRLCRYDQLKSKRTRGKKISLV